MLGRYEDYEQIKPLPQNWQEDFISVLNTAYHDRSEKESKFFDVYGSIMDKEFLVIVSYIHKSDPLVSPVSIFISHDIISDEKQMKSALKSIVDLAAEILDDVFSVSGWNNYVLNWTENNYKGNSFHYKITRENISLTMQANEILQGNLPD